MIRNFPAVLNFDLFIRNEPLVLLDHRSQTNDWGEPAASYKLPVEFEK